MRQNIPHTKTLDMVGITIIGDSSSISTPHLSSKKSSKKPKYMKTTILFGLIGILFVLMFLGYWKISTRFESIERLIKIQDNLPTTPITTTTATTTTTTTTTTAITTTEKEEFGPKSCDDVYIATNTPFVT